MTQDDGKPDDWVVGQPGWEWSPSRQQTRIQVTQDDGSVSSAGRATSLGPQDIFLLDQWGRQLHEAFGEMPYLVGSVARSALLPRDVDVRMLIPSRLKRTMLTRSAELAIRTMNVALTLWGRQVTGLPIDFQMQTTEEFHKYDSEIRNPLGPRSKAGWRLA